MVKHLIFDLDGTLVDSAPAILECFKSVLAKHEIQPSVEVNEKLIGPPLDESIKRITGIVDECKIGLLMHSFKDIYDGTACLETIQYGDFTYVLETLVARGYFLSIATNKRYTPTMSVLNSLGWMDLFHKIFSCDVPSGRYTDKTGMLSELIKDLAVDNAECVYVGDTLLDKKAALHNNIRFYAVGWGYGAFDSSERAFSAPEELLVEFL